MFKRHKKRNQDETADAGTVDSFTTEPPDQFMGVEAGDDYNLSLGIAMSESAREAQVMPSLDGAESGSSIRYMASYSNGHSSHSESLSSAYYFNGM